MIVDTKDATARTEQLLRCGRFRDACEAIAPYLSSDGRSPYDRAREYVLHRWPRLLDAMRYRTVEVRCSFCGERDIRILPVIDACATCGCGEMVLDRPVPERIVLAERGAATVSRSSQSVRHRSPNRAWPAVSYHVTRAKRRGVQPGVAQHPVLARARGRLLRHTDGNNREAGPVASSATGTDSDEESAPTSDGGGEGSDENDTSD